MKSNIENLVTVGKSYLTQNNFPNREAYFSTAFLLSSLLSFPSYSELQANREKTVDKKVRKKFYRFLRRRAKGEPSQYITGEAPFMDFSLAVNSNCLIPRPSTELLIEKVIEWLKENSLTGPHLKILDIGTGSGNIPIALAKYLENASITAVDICPEALAIAEENVRQNKVAPKINFRKGFLFDALSQKNYFDLIIANLPYLSEEDMATAEAEIHFEPKGALQSGKTGLDLIEKTIPQAFSFLREGGALFLEFGKKQGGQIKKLLEKNHYRKIHMYQNYDGVDLISRGVK